MKPDICVPSPGMRVAILQSNYIPWRGYFDIIHDVDLFVFYDDVQYTRRDWRNRNKVKTSQGSKWLTIPTDGDREHLICDVGFADPKWQRTHWQALREHYSKSAFFSHYRNFFEEYYLGQAWTKLSEFNQALTRGIAAELLHIDTKFADSRSYGAQGAKRDRIMSLLSKIGAHSYVSGPAAKDYLDPQEFVAQGIELIWKDYPEYPEYPQFHPPFDPYVTVLDLLFHVGPEAPNYIWGWRSGPGRAAVARPSQEEHDIARK